MTPLTSGPERAGGLITGSVFFWGKESPADYLLMKCYFGYFQLEMEKYWVPELLLEHQLQFWRRTYSQRWCGVIGGDSGGGEMCGSDINSLH